jgi:hypothetical protein
MQERRMGQQMRGTAKMIHPIFENRAEMRFLAPSRDTSTNLVLAPIPCARAFRVQGSMIPGQFIILGFFHLVCSRVYVTSVLFFKGSGVSNPV